MNRFLLFLWWIVTLIMAIFVAIALDNGDGSFFVLILSVVTAISMFLLSKKTYEVTQGKAPRIDKKRRSSDKAELDAAQPTRLSTATNIASHELEVTAQSAQVSRDNQGSGLRLFGMHYPVWVIIGLSFLFIMMISAFCCLVLLLYQINL